VLPCPDDDLVAHVLSGKQSLGVFSRRFVPPGKLSHKALLILANAPHRFLRAGPRGAVKRI